MGDRKAYFKQHFAEWSKKTRLNALEKLCGGKPICEECGCSYIEFLEINHKKGGGDQARKAKKWSMWSFYKRIADGLEPIDDLNVLCKICNITHYVNFTAGYDKVKVSIVWK